MKNIITLSLILAVGFVLNACSNDPLIPPQQNNDGYQQVYHEPGVQDSMAIGAVMIDYLDIGVVDLTNSDSMKISFDYIAYNTLTYRLRIYYQDENLYPVYIADIDVSGNQNTYKHIEFTAPSPNSSRVFYYTMGRSSPADSYMVTRNFKVSKK